jgi:membrane-associated phospholipid phosphatase
VSITTAIDQAVASARELRRSRQGRTTPGTDLAVYTRTSSLRNWWHARPGLRTRFASLWRNPNHRSLALAVAAALLAAAAFARVAEDYLTNDPLARWDVSLARWLAGERNSVGNDFFRVFTYVGSPAGALAISFLACVVLYRRRRLAEVALLAVVLAGGELLNVILKLAFHRPRPEVAIVHLDTYSFPSGHAMLSTAAYGTLAYLAWGRWRTTPARLAVALGAVVLVALISFSRLYLGAHYLSDVLGGAAGGVFWLAVSIVLYTLYGERFERRFADSSIDRFARRIARS